MNMDDIYPPERLNCGSTETVSPYNSEPNTPAQRMSGKTTTQRDDEDSATSGTAGAEGTTTRVGGTAMLAPIDLILPKSEPDVILEIAEEGADEHEDGGTSTAKDAAPFDEGSEKQQKKEFDRRLPSIFRPISPEEKNKEKELMGGSPPVVNMPPSIERLTINPNKQQRPPVSDVVVRSDEKPSSIMEDDAHRGRSPHRRPSPPTEKMLSSKKPRESSIRKYKDLVSRTKERPWRKSQSPSFLSEQEDNDAPEDEAIGASTMNAPSGVIDAIEASRTHDDDVVVPRDYSAGEHMVTVLQSLDVMKESDFRSMGVVSRKDASQASSSTDRQVSAGTSSKNIAANGLMVEEEKKLEKEEVSVAMRKPSDMVVQPHTMILRGRRTPSPFGGKPPRSPPKKGVIRSATPTNEVGAAATALPSSQSNARRSPAPDGDVVSRPPQPQVGGDGVRLSVRKSKIKSRQSAADIVAATEKQDNHRMTGATMAQHHRNRVPRVVDGKPDSDDVSSVTLSKALQEDESVTFHTVAYSDVSSLSGSVGPGMRSDDTISTTDSSSLAPQIARDAGAVPPPSSRLVYTDLETLQEMDESNSSRSPIQRIRTSQTSMEKVADPILRTRSDENMALVEAPALGSPKPSSKLNNAGTERSAFLPSKAVETDGQLNGVDEETARKLENVGSTPPTNDDSDNLRKMFDAAYVVGSVASESVLMATESMGEIVFGSPHRKTQEEIAMAWRRRKRLAALEAKEARLEEGTKIYRPGLPPNLVTDKKDRNDDDSNVTEVVKNRGLAPGAVAADREDQVMRSARQAIKTMLSESSDDSPPPPPPPPLPLAYRQAEYLDNKNFSQPRHSARVAPSSRSAGTRSAAAATAKINGAESQSPNLGSVAIVFSKQSPITSPPLSPTTPMDGPEDTPKSQSDHGDGDKIRSPLSPPVSPKVAALREAVVKKSMEKDITSERAGVVDGPYFTASKLGTMSIHSNLSTDSESSVEVDVTTTRESADGGLLSADEIEEDVSSFDKAWQGNDSQVDKVSALTETVVDSIGSSEATRQKTNETIAMIKPIDDINGIAKGDIVLSLLKTGSTNNATEHGKAQVNDAIWRIRTMRKEASRIEAGLPRKEDSRTKRSVLPVDVDNVRVLGGIKNIRILEKDALDHLKNDEIDEALELYEDIIYGYTETFKKREQAKQQGELSNSDVVKEDYRQYIGTALHNIGVLHCLKGAFVDAHSFFVRAASSKSVYFGEGHSEHLVSLNKAALCLFAQDKFEEAHRELEVVFKLGKKKCQSVTDYMQLAEVMNNIGCLCFMCGEFTKALSHFEESIKVQNKILTTSLYGGPKLAGQCISLNLSITRSNVGFIKMLDREYKLATELFESAMITQQMLVPDYSDALCATMDHLAIVNSLGGNKEKGLQILARMLESQIDNYGADSTQAEGTITKIKLIKNGNLAAVLNNSTKRHSVRMAKSSPSKRLSFRKQASPAKTKSDPLSHQSTMENDSLMKDEPMNSNGKAFRTPSLKFKNPFKKGKKEPDSVSIETSA